MDCNNQQMDTKVGDMLVLAVDKQVLAYRLAQAHGKLALVYRQALVVGKLALVYRQALVLGKLVLVYILVLVLGKLVRVCIQAPVYILLVMAYNKLDQELVLHDDEHGEVNHV